MMPLVEVVLGERTGTEAANTVFALSRRLGKTPVFVKDSPGFLVNRLLTFYSIEAQRLLAEGYRIEDVDRAMKDWGMPMGPLALGDEVGLDVAVEVAKVLHEAWPDRLPLPESLEKVVAAGLLGKKSGRGLYEWEARKRTGPNKEVYALAGVHPSVDEPDPRYLQERMVLPMVNEAARCLEEGVVASAGEVDLAMIFGTGFPPFRGGPCRWADTQGLSWVIGTLERLTTVGPRYAPSEALRRTAQEGGFYARFGDIGEKGKAGGGPAAEHRPEPAEAPAG
jgi:3-hydroxyacyl-CoA dehydrogenase